jgi:hypothetical protein
MEKSGGSLRRRSSAKDQKSVDGGAPAAKPNNTKLIEAEKTETGKVIIYSSFIHFFFTKL